MASKEEKKNLIRQRIIEASNIYSKNLTGNIFLYVYGDEYFEVMFPTECFLHLTGVDTYLSAKSFYDNAKSRKLTTNQFYFKKDHNFLTVKKKLGCLVRLPELTNREVCILKDMKTLKIIYKLSITNLEFTLGLTENINSMGKKINDYYIPMTLRVKDKSIENSSGGEVVDFIFKKNASISKYDCVLVKDNNKIIPDWIHKFLDDKLVK